jgi:hypothetical protein
VTEQTVVVGVGTYQSRAGADLDCDAVADRARAPEVDHVAAALVEKGRAGQLTIARQEGTDSDIGWRRALLGAALVVVAAPLGICVLVPVVPSSKDWDAVAALVAHFWQDIPKAQLRGMSDLLEAHQAAVLLVAVDGADDQVGVLLGNAQPGVVIARASGDFEGDYARVVP